MQKTVLLLDGSSAINSCVDYVPNRLQALRPCIKKLVHALLDTTPLSLLGVVVMRDNIAQTIVSLSNNANEIQEALELRYFLHGGSGSLSLDKGLRAAFSELIELRKRSIKSSMLRVLLVSANVTLVDGSDVLTFIPLINKARIRVDALHLVGVVQAIQTLVDATGGEYLCPLNFDHMARMLEDIAHCKCRLPGSHRDSEKEVNNKKRARDEDIDDGIPIGFPLSMPSTERPGKVYLVCPRCNLPQTHIPSVCPLCGILVCSLPFVHVSFIWRNHLIPPLLERRSGVADSADGVSVDDRCALCDSPTKIDFSDSEATTPATDVCTSGDSVQCSECRQWRCKDCDDFVKSSLGVCPTCVA